MTFADTASFLVMGIGLACTMVLLYQHGRDYRSGHSRWSFRACVMLSTVSVVWLAFLAALLGRTGYIDPEIATYFTFGGRVALLTLVVWLLVLPHVPDDHPPHRKSD